MKSGGGVSGMSPIWPKLGQLTRFGLKTCWKPIFLSFITVKNDLELKNCEKPKKFQNRFWSVAILPMCLSKSWHIYSFISLWRATIWCQAVPVISSGFDATAPGRSGTFGAVPILYGHESSPNFTWWTALASRSFSCILSQSTSPRGEIRPKMCFHFPILLKQQLVTDGHSWSHLVTPGNMSVTPGNKYTDICWSLLAPDGHNCHALVTKCPKNAYLPNIQTLVSNMATAGHII